MADPRTVIDGLTFIRAALPNNPLSVRASPGVAFRSDRLGVLSYQSLWPPHQAKYQTVKPTIVSPHRGSIQLKEE